MSDEPLPVLPVDGAPDVSGIGATPADPELPPLRMSGAAGVLTSTPLLDVPASERPFDVLPEPTAAGVLPGLDSLRRSQPARANAATSPHKHGSRAGEESFTKRPIQHSCPLSAHQECGRLRSPMKPGWFSSCAGVGTLSFLACLAWSRVGSPAMPRPSTIGMGVVWTSPGSGGVDKGSTG
jgi:hypothetical protein